MIGVKTDTQYHDVDNINLIEQEEHRGRRNLLCNVTHQIWALCILGYGLDDSPCRRVLVIIAYTTSPPDERIAGEIRSTGIPLGVAGASFPGETGLTG